MITLIKRYSVLISALLLLILLVLIWLFPSSGLTLGIFFLLFSFVIASFVIVEKHRQAYLQGKISREVFTRNVLFDITGILLALILAGLLGRYIAEIATKHIDNQMIKLIAGIIVGLLIGIGVGIIVRQMWGRVIRTLPRS